jgi:hypothetical protein
MFARSAPSGALLAFGSLRLVTPGEYDIPSAARLEDLPVLIGTE